jgi:Cu2+-exporting ATPase
VTVELCSGDRPANVAELARALGVTGVGGRSPADKPARILELQATGARVLFAGDGVNDAPALRAADVGVALASGTAAARQQAQVEVLGDDLLRLPALIDGSRRLRAVVRGNLAWTLAYNAVALVLAVQGRLHPLVAAGAMIVSSVVVSVRSYRLLERREDRP